MARSEMVVPFRCREPRETDGVAAPAERAERRPARVLPFRKRTPPAPPANATLRARALIDGDPSFTALNLLGILLVGFVLASVVRVWTPSGKALPGALLPVETRPVAAPPARPLTVAPPPVAPLAVSVAPPVVPPAPSTVPPGSATAPRPVDVPSSARPVPLAPRDRLDPPWDER